MDTKRVGALGAAVSVLAVLWGLHRPNDIHAEYVKFLSGKDTITAYLAYPERPAPAPAVIVIHEIFGMSVSGRQPPKHFGRAAFAPTPPIFLPRGAGPPPPQTPPAKWLPPLPPDPTPADLTPT